MGEVLDMARETKTESKAVYPTQYETKVLLKDGSSILLRPIREDDAERWLAFAGRLSSDTKYLFSTQPRMTISALE